MTPEEFEQDILRNKTGAARLLGLQEVRSSFPRSRKARHAQLRDRFRSFLAQHGYRNGAATIDASDWYYNQRLPARMEAATAGSTRCLYQQPYLEHIWDRARFYDQLSHDVLGRSVPHTLLIHFNLLNSLFLGDLLAMFRLDGVAR